MYDLCIIGGGAAGMSAAITAGKLGLKVIIIDKNEKLGRKIYATGNGRCNLTNTDFDKDYSKYYNSNDKNYTDFLNCFFDDFENPCESVISFMDSISIKTYEKDGYVYPLSNQASSVMWAFNDAIKKYNIDVEFKAQFEEVHIDEAMFRINVSNRVIEASNLILACGGASYIKLGGSYSSYMLARSLCHTVTEIRPALCGLITKESFTDLSGVRTKCKASLFNGKEFVSCEEGELQFTEYGISGIMIFNLSSKAGQLMKSGNKPTISIDFIPSITDEITDSLYNEFSDRTINGLLNSLINDKLASFILQSLCINPKEKVFAISKKDYDVIIRLLHNYQINILDTNDFENAQVTAGGVNISEISPKTMMSEVIQRLYIIGEMLDIDGICGGYNLSFAILSGIKAGQSIYDTIKSNKDTSIG